MIMDANTVPTPVAAQSRPDWLPEGWRFKAKIRRGGSKEGVIDKCYYHPEGRLFRSKKQVLSFLETGNPKKRSPKMNGEEESGDDDAARTFFFSEEEKEVARILLQMSHGL